MSFQHGSTDIPSRLILKLAPSSSPSGQLHFNHEGCPAGEDTKKRLYIKIPHARPWERIAYCHNCGGSGYAKLRSDNWLGEYQTHTQFYAPDVSNRPSNNRFNVEYNIDAWYNAQAERYIHGYLSLEEIHKYAIGYTPDTQRLVYHSFYSDGSIGTTQYRAVYKGQKPKYLTDRVPNKVQQCDPITDGSPSDTLVLTEDLLSSIVVHRAGVHTMPCFGTHLPTEVLHNLSKKYKRIFVWFDNDNPLVIDQAKSMVRTLQLLNTESSGYVMLNEPKKLYKKNTPTLDFLVMPEVNTNV